MRLSSARWKWGLLGLSLLVCTCFIVTRSAKWTLEKSRKAAPFRIVQGTTFLNTVREISKTSGFWAEYSTSFGATASPIAVVTFVKLTNLTDKPELIRNYSVAFRADRCRWMDLFPMPSKDVSVLYLVNGFKQASLVDLGNNGLDSELKAPILPNETVAGFLFFDTPVSCRVDPGDKIQYRFSLATADGESYKFTSQPSEPMSNSETSAIDSQLASKNSSVDLSSTIKAIRFWSDPLPLVNR
jgi:hypothetical protein